MNQSNDELMTMAEITASVLSYYYGRTVIIKVSPKWRETCVIKCMLNLADNNFKEYVMG